MNGNTYRRPSYDVSGYRSPPKTPSHELDPSFSNTELKEKLDFEKRITEEIIKLKEHLLDVRRKLADAYPYV